MAEDGGGGFALPEYVVPKAGFQASVLGGTVPKAAMEVGGMLGEAKKRAANPGPERYNKDFLNKSFSHASKGGTFSKLTRDSGLGVAKTPAVGSYETVSPQTLPKPKGGIVPKTDRGCIFFDMAMADGKWKQAPGKYVYNSEALVPHKMVPTFQNATTESRVAKQKNNVGPGHYNLKYVHTEQKVITYSGSKEATRSFLDKHLKGKDKVPAPGHHGIAESKVEDRAGKRLHSQRILADRIITPRTAPARGSTPSASSPTGS